MITLKLLSVIFLTQSFLVTNCQNQESGIVCDGLKCPKMAKVCLVKKDSIPSTDQMTVEKTCKSKDGML